MKNRIQSTITLLVHSIFLLGVFLIGSQSMVYGQTAKEQGILDTFGHKEVVVYKTVDGMELNMTVFYPDPDKIQERNPWMLYVHGGGWAGGSKYNILKKPFLGTLRSLLDNGVICFTIEYRLARGSSTAYDAVVDAKDAARFLLKNAEKYKLDMERYGIWGGSAGGHLSLVTALGNDVDFQGDPLLKGVSPKFKCVASYFPFTSCVNPDIRPGSIFEDGKLFVRLLGAPLHEKPELARLLSPTELLKESSPPILLLHGDQDTTLPIINSIYMKEVAAEKNADVQLLTVKNAGHVFKGQDISPSMEEINDHAATFILSHLKETNVPLQPQNRNDQKEGPMSKNAYWNNDTPLVPFRLPPAPIGYQPTYIDLDQDGDPDILRTITIHNTPVQWIDDDDDLKVGDIEGDTDSDCVMVDVNKDGKYGDYGDLAVDWIDTDGDGKADMQVLVENSEREVSKMSGPGQHYMWVLDTDNDNVFNYIDWNTFKLRAWLHEGSSNFMEDYNGQSTFLKIHASTYFMDDVRLNWENPFLFFDQDDDGLSDMAVRVLDRYKGGSDKPTGEGLHLTGNAGLVAVTYDMDNDNAPGNEFDFDMSFRFTGKGFNYMDQVHEFKNSRVVEADSFFIDSRWRKITELLYPDHNNVLDLTYDRGEWDEIYFVYDEDDDCERWERVEFYDPLDPFKTGLKNGGLDNNQQADAIGDRGEWDLDNSGNANLYISKFDGRLHLYGAEWGCWRIDQLAYSYQGWGGLYNEYTPRWERLQKEFHPFGTFKYEDTDNNGFLDKIEMDIDGDKRFERTILLKDLGIDDQCEIINTSKMGYGDYRKLHTTMSNDIWKKAEKAIRVAEAYGLNTSWYALMKNPKSENQKYQYGYWLQFYIYMDLMYKTMSENKNLDVEKINKAYFGGNWDMLMD
ncbi:alpha/beta hydrolase [Maribacter polysaccharolyticus]|uniref:alpha/beta hydrolase n=1 Tax=Maribacter polysaccharolyticus TaxID=3020831 RepID=UPI00237F106E|nr:alpha/beta hydrolase [Maribacter polysaccharolyticus]